MLINLLISKSNSWKNQPCKDSWVGGSEKRSRKLRQQLLFHRVRGRILSYWLPGDVGDMPVCVSSFISVTYKVYGCHHFLFNQRWMDDINHYKTLNSPTELTGPQPRKSGFSFVKNHLLMVLKCLYLSLLVTRKPQPLASATASCYGNDQSKRKQKNENKVK